MSYKRQFCIAVPVGAYHPTFETCLASLAAQSVRPQVALLDASDDPRVSNIADKFADLFTYRAHGPDGGQSDAIAKGWDNMSGDVLGWLNADDVMAPECLAHAARAFEANPEASIVYGHSEICDDAGWLTGYHWNVLPSLELILSTCSISQPSCFFTREALRSIGGLDRDLHYTMDWDLWIRFYLKGCTFEFINEVMSLVLWSTEAKTGGLGKGRRRELRRLLDMNPDAGSRRAGYVGFVTHHLKEYVLPRHVRGWLWRHDADGGTGLFGLSVSGDIPKAAQITLFHFENCDKKYITIATGSSEAAFCITVDGARATFVNRRPDGVLIYQLATPLVGGIRAQLVISRASEMPISVSGVKLLG